MSVAPLERLRKHCLAFPEAHEVEAWGAPTFRVRNKLFAMFAHAESHHGGGRPGVWCKSTRLEQDLLVRADPERFFVPPYVGVGGWVGIRLDRKPDWKAVADLLRDAWRLTAPTKLVATSDAERDARVTAPPSRAREREPDGSTRAKGARSRPGE